MDSRVITELPAARHRAFAAQLCGARRSDSRVPPVERALRRARLSVSRPMRVHLSLALRLAAAARQAPVAAASLVRQIQRVECVRTIERLVELQRSLATRVIEYRGAQSVATPAAAAPTLVRERIERHTAWPAASTTVVHRHEKAPASRATVNRDEPVASARRHVAPPLEAARAALPAAFTLPVQELSRVTDHVIEQLDRRVLSYRERQGRV